MRRPIARPTGRQIRSGIRGSTRRWGALGVTMALLAGGLSATAGSVHADGVSDQQQQVKDDLAEIDRLQQKASQLNEEYLGYLNQKAELEAEIGVGQQQIDAQQAQLDALQEQLAAVAVQQFTGGSGGLALLGDTANATDSLQRDQLLRTAVNAGAASMDDYDALLDQLSSANADLQAKQDKVAKLADQASDALDRTKQAGLDYQAELERDQATLGDLLAEEQARQVAQAAAQHAAQVAQSKADEKAAADRAAAKQAADEQAAKDRAANDQAATNQAATNQAATNQAANEQASKDQGTKDQGVAADVTVATAAEVVTGDVADTGSNDSSSDSSNDSSSSALESAPPVSSRAEIAVAAARSQLGVPYQYAMSSPGVAFDCSGLTAYAWAKAGVSIPHQSAMQYASTPHVAIADVQPGDLLFFYSPISHVSIYIGNGMEIHAPAPGKFVEIASVNWSKVVGASRPG